MFLFFLLKYCVSILIHGGVRSGLTTFPIKTFGLYVLLKKKFGGP